jgi:hypothetical protein
MTRKDVEERVSIQWEKYFNDTWYRAWVCGLPVEIFNTSDVFKLVIGDACEGSFKTFEDAEICVKRFYTNAICELLKIER